METAGICACGLLSGVVFLGEIRYNSPIKSGEAGDRFMTKQTTNVCKGVAILLMFWHHLFYSSEKFADFPFSPMILTAGQIVALAQAMKICVAIFVFLTAYGTAKQYQQRNIQTAQQITGYSLSRYCKLMCGFWVVFFLSQITAFLGRSQVEVYGKSLFQGVVYWLIDFFGLAKILGTPTFNATWWYMSYAILLIFLMPVVICFVRRFGAVVAILLAFLVPMYCAANMKSTFFLYLPLLVLGCAFAQLDLFQRISSALKGSLWKQSLMLLVCLVGLVLGAYLRRKGYRCFGDTGATLAICLICHLWLTRIPGVVQLLVLFGKHSMNLFLLHTFIFGYYFKPFVYGWKYPIVIFCVLAVTSLLVSVVIEKGKQLCHFDRGVKKLTAALEGIMKGRPAAV